MNPTSPPGIHRPRSKWSLLALVFLLVHLLAGDLPQVSAQNRNNSFSTKPVRGRGILTVQTELSIPSSMSSGYGKVLIKDVKGASSADRDLVVVLYIKDWGSSNTSLAYRYPIRLAEGQASVEIQIPFVGVEANNTAWDVTVFEDGKDIENTTNQLNQASFQWLFNNGAATELSVGCLVATANDPAVELANVYSISPSSLPSGVPANIGVVAGGVMPNSEVIRVVDASADWRRYYPYTMWLLSADAVVEINEQRPEVAAALRTYVAAGGTLFVYDVPSVEASDAVDRLLSTSGSNPKFTPWTSNFDGNAASDVRTLVERLKDKPSGRILTRSYANGRVLLSNVAIASLGQDSIGGVLEQEKSSKWKLPSPGYDGNWFWRNMIGSVGKPPIWIFVGIVTLFGAFLGPGLLHLTGRLKRRSLMIFLVPACSLVATLLIVSYGVLHEGFGTSIRITSVTVYDTPSNVAFAWSRQNYFSGLPPREGLVFPKQAFVRPVHAEAARSYAGSPDPKLGVRCTVEMTENQVWKGWLLPRQHQQLMVGHAVEASTLPINISPGEANALMIKNLTDQTLPIVVVRGETDQYFTAVDLKPSEERACLAEDKTSAAKIVSRIGVEARPKIPVEMQESSGSLISFGRSGRMSSNRVNEADDVINATYRRTMTGTLDFQPFEFAALVPKFEQIAIPLKGQQTQNVNLVTGVAPW